MPVPLLGGIWTAVCSTRSSSGMFGSADMSVYYSVYSRVDWLVSDIGIGTEVCWWQLAYLVVSRQDGEQCFVHCVAGGSLKKVFTCQLCGKVLCSKASLKRHIADKHAERQEEYRCVICERVYCSRNSLMTHIYTYHKSRPGDIDIKFF